MIKIATTKKGRPTKPKEIKAESTDVIETGKQIIETEKPKKLRYVQQLREDLIKNPPNAPSPEFIKDLFRPGRPPRFTNPDEMKILINEYFDDKLIELKDEQGNVEGFKWREPITLSGLALWLHMSRQTLLEYSKDKDYSVIVKNARQIIENYHENALTENRNPAGTCFILKNGYGWQDKQEYIITPNNQLDTPDAKAISDRYSSAPIEADFKEKN